MAEPGALGPDALRLAAPQPLMRRVLPGEPRDDLRWEVAALQPARRG
jgi:hypothetical protein